MPRDTFNFLDPPTRLGGTAINRFSVIGGGATNSFDMCLHQGEIWAVHIDECTPEDNPDGFSSLRGPFVEKFNGAWANVGGEMETFQEFLPFVEGSPGQGRHSPDGCQIASDGTDVYVVYVLRQYYNPPGPENAYLARNVVIRKWDGGTWTLLHEYPGSSRGVGNVFPSSVIFGPGSFGFIFFDASPLDPGRCHAAWEEFDLFYANSGMASPNILIPTNVGIPTPGEDLVIPPSTGDMRIGSNGRPYLFCQVDFFLANPETESENNHFAGSRMIDCLSGNTVQFLDGSLFSSQIFPGAGTAWGFVRQGDAFPGNHPNYDDLWQLGIGGVLWRDTDPNAAAGMASTRAAGFRAGIWTVAGNDQTASSFAAQASALVGAFAPDLLVLDCEFVAKGYAPDDPSFDPTYGTGWHWSEDMMAELRILQPVQTMAVTMLPVQADHADFNFEAYTSRRCGIWPQAYDGDVNPIDPVGMFQSTVANGVDPNLIVVVLGAPDYADEVDAMIEAGYLTWAVFTLDDLPGTPTSTLPPPTDPASPNFSGGPITSVSPIINHDGRDLLYCMVAEEYDGHPRVVQVPADASGPFELFDGDIQFARPFYYFNSFVPGTVFFRDYGNPTGTFALDPVSDNLYFAETYGAEVGRVHGFQRQCPIHEWLDYSNITSTGVESFNTFPPFADPDVQASDVTFSASCEGRALILLVGEEVYVMVHYTAQGLVTYTGADTGNPNDYRCNQYIVYKQNICRLCQACSSPVAGPSGAPFLDIEFRGEDSNANPAAADDHRPDANFSGVRFRAE